MNAPDTVVRELSLTDWAACTLALRGRPLVITCLAGGLHVTCEGDPVDHVLAPGDVLRVACPGRVVAAALPAGSLRCSAPRAKLAWRWRRAAAGEPRPGLLARGRQLLGGLGLVAVVSSLVG